MDFTSNPQETIKTFMSFYNTVKERKNVGLEANKN